MINFFRGGARLQRCSLLSSNCMRAFSFNDYKMVGDGHRSSNLAIIPKMVGAPEAPNLGLINQGTILSELTNRAIISVRGPDSSKLLQNLTTCDMMNFVDDHPFRAAQYTSFLNPRGRVMFDAIIAKPQLAGQGMQQDFLEFDDDIEYWIDV